MPAAETARKHTPQPGCLLRTQQRAKPPHQPNSQRGTSGPWCSTQPPPTHGTTPRAASPGVNQHQQGVQNSPPAENLRWELLRKEVIQPHLPVRLPCYDFVLIAGPTFDRSPRTKTVRPRASGVTNFHDVTGGVYKARERIHRSIADLRLLATPTSRGRVADPDPN
jgi:hypothetical protein